MRCQRLTAYGLLFAVLLAFPAIVALTCRAPREDLAPLPISPPDSMGEFAGEALRFCQNEQCLRSFDESTLAGAAVCPVCGGALDRLSVGEKTLLPADTVIEKRLYHAPGGEDVLVTAVLTGRERRSIHKPEVCLVAQGYSIIRQRVIQVPLEGRQPLAVTLLDLRRSNAPPDDPDAAMTFAYWFVSASGETPRHWVRLARTAWDGVVHNRRTRWAYLSIAARRVEHSDAHVERMIQFIRLLHPRLSRHGGAAP